MTPTRMAKELYAHAVLYAIGKGFLAVSPTKILLDAILKSLGVKNSVINSLNTVTKKIREVEKKLGMYLVEHAGYIEINNNESTKRMIIYELIWRMGVV